MSTNCKVCSRKAKRYGGYCNSHASRNRRYGHPKQATILASRLHPYVRDLRDYIARHPEPDLWAAMLKVWSVIVRRSRGAIAEYHSGRPFDRHEAEAHAALLRVAGHVEPRKIVQTVVAFAMFAKAEPGSFQTDRALWFSLARRFRTLTRKNAVTYPGQPGYADKRAYPDAAPRAAEYLGRLLMMHLGVFGDRIRTHDMEEKVALYKAKEAAYRALEAAAGGDERKAA